MQLLITIQGLYCWCVLFNMQIAHRAFIFLIHFSPLLGFGSFFFAYLLIDIVSSALFFSLLRWDYRSSQAHYFFIILVWYWSDSILILCAIACIHLRAFMQSRHLWTPNLFSHTYTPGPKIMPTLCVLKFTPVIFLRHLNIQREWARKMYLFMLHLNNKTSVHCNNRQRSFGEWKK